MLQFTHSQPSTFPSPYFTLLLHSSVVRSIHQNTILLTINPCLPLPSTVQSSLYFILCPHHLQPAHICSLSEKQLVLCKPTFLSTIHNYGGNILFLIVGEGATEALTMGDICCYALTEFQFLFFKEGPEIPSSNLNYSLTFLGILILNKP